jgi:hypothetical protein
MVKCVTAPVMKRAKNTTVIGTSTEMLGMPPTMAFVGSKGPMDCFVVIIVVERGIVAANAAG